MALNYLGRRNHGDGDTGRRWIAPRLGPEPHASSSEVFDSGARTIVDCAHVRVERLDTHPVQFSKVFKQFEDWRGQKYDYRYWAERENLFLREFLKRQHEFTHVVQARHLISENEAAKQVLTCDAGITIANWLRVKARYADTATLSHPFQRADSFLGLLRACLMAGGIQVCDQSIRDAAVIVKQIVASVVSNAAFAGHHIVERGAEHGRLQQSIEGSSRHSGPPVWRIRTSGPIQDHCIDQLPMFVSHANRVSSPQRAGN